MATIFQVFDLKEAARSGAKQLVPERRYFDGGFEAPRNSLDVPYEAADVSRSGTFKGEDIPFGYEYFTPALAAGVRRTPKSGAARSLSHGNSPRQSENRKRAPNVVARLMGLEALPDELPARKHSLPSTPVDGSPVKPVRGKPGLTRQRSQGAVPSSWQRPPLPRQAPRACAPGEDERVLAPVLPFRDHPQEEQLRKFKKEFEAKQQAAVAKKEEQLRVSQLQEMNRELEEKKEKVRATLDKAKSALSQGNVAKEPKRRSAQGQFEESKEFLDAMKFLQSNKDLIFEFLQQKPQGAGKSGNSNTATAVTLLKSVQKGKGSAEMSPGARKREGLFSPRALARLIMNPRKWNDSKQQPATPSDTVSQPSPRAPPAAIDGGNGSGSRRASTDEKEPSNIVKLRSSSFSSSRSELGAAPSPEEQSKASREEANVSNKASSRDVIVKIMERLRQKEQCGSVGEKAEKERFLREQTFRRDSNDIARTISDNARESSQSRNNFTLTEYLSTGKRVSMHLEDMDDVRYTSDGEDSSTPLVKIVRDNAIKRSSISLPSSPHLAAQSNGAATSSKVMRKRGAIVKHGTPAAATHKEAKKATLTSETPRRRQGRGSLLSNTEVENSLRKSASFNENACRSEDLKQRVAASAAAASRRCPEDQNKEPASNLTRSRSIPNVALLRRRGKLSNEAVQNLNSSGERHSENSLEGKSITEITPKQRLCQQAEKTRGFFAGGRKKVRDGPEAMSPVQSLLFPSTAPVLARFAALAESCVSQGKTLSDADNGVDVKLRVRSIGNAGARKGKENSRVQVLPTKKESTSRTFGKPSQAEIESVVSESSAGSDADSCDGDLLGALDYLRPLAKTTTGSGVSREALPSTVFVPRVHQQVRNLKKRPDPEPPRDWTGHFDASNKVDDEVDSNGDINGQPSPVSVLEAPFEEEAPSVEFKEIADSLKDLRLRLNLLKDQGGKRTEDALEHVPKVAHTPRLERQHQSLDSARENQTLTDLQQRKPSATSTHRQSATSATPSLPCRAAQEAALAFVANVLVGSDFITHGGRLVSKWHSATQPISPNLYASLEASHYSDNKGSANRRVLFDAINDILAAKLRPLCYEPWTGADSSGAVVRTGRRLVADVWNEICKRQFPAALWRNDLHDDYLESLVAQDLKSSTSWMSLHHDVHGLCLHLEKSIFSSLITELCEDLLAV